LFCSETSPAKLASLADRREKASAEELREAPRGRATKHHRSLLRLHLNQIDLSEPMATLDAQVVSHRSRVDPVNPREPKRLASA
jgi:transposase